MYLAKVAKRARGKEKVDPMEILMEEKEGGLSRVVANAITVEVPISQRIVQSPGCVTHVVQKIT